LAPLRFFSLPETGGTLHVATHAYYYAGGHAERDETRRIMARRPDWKIYVGRVLPDLDTQASTIWAEAPFVTKQYPQVHGLATVPTDLPGDNTILELRRYKLKLGYDTVPKFLELYAAGLPSKLNAPGTDPTTSLVSVLYTEVGRLNEVLEIWRHGGGSAAMEASRQAARGAADWRLAIASIADLAVEFTSTIHKPTAFSPIK
jgi:NIPSNAP